MFTVNLKDTRFTFYNHPVYYDPRKYDQVKDNFIENFKKIEAISAIYQLGTSTHPGISDLDLMIIIGENRGTYKLQKRLYEYYHSLPREYRYILNHRPFIVNESLFHKIHCLVPIFEMRQLWGEKYSVDDIERAEFREYQLIHLIDILIAYDWTREFLDNIIHGSVNVRKLLVKLRSKVRYPIRIYERVTRGGKGEWTEYLEEVDSLRERWFSLDNKEREDSLLRLSERAIHILIELVTEADFLFKKELGISENGGQVLYDCPEKNTLFIHRWDGQKLFDIVLKGYANGKRAAILPLSFSALPAAYAKHEGPVSRFIKRHLVGSTVDVDSQEIYNKAQLINAYVEFLLTNYLLFGIFFGFYGYPGYSFCQRLKYINLTKITRYLKHALLGNRS